MENNEFIDVDFNEQTNEKHINGKALYYTTSQVSILLNESDSTIRFWCSKFKDILQIETSGTHRRFKESDIEQLKYIKKLLREEGYSINQVLEYCSEKDVSVIENKLVQNDPLAIKAIATALGIEMTKRMDNFKEEILHHISFEINDMIGKQALLHEENKEDLKDYIATTIHEKINDSMNDIKLHLNNQEQIAKERDSELINTLRKSQEEQKKLLEQKSQGFFSRIFKK